VSRLPPIHHHHDHAVTAGIDPHGRGGMQRAAGRGRDLTRHDQRREPGNYRSGSIGWAACGGSGHQKLSRIFASTCSPNSFAWTTSR
jgi:hypothetical protein